MRFSELNNAAYTLAIPGFIHTLTGYARRFATGSVANLPWWDLSLFRSHPLGNNSQFHGFPVNPKTLNLTRHDDPALNEFPQPSVVNVVEKSTDIHI